MVSNNFQKSLAIGAIALIMVFGGKIVIFRQSESLADISVEYQELPGVKSSNPIPTFVLRQLPTASPPIAAQNLENPLLQAPIQSFPSSSASSPIIAIDTASSSVGKRIKKILNDEKLFLQEPKTPIEDFPSKTPASPKSFLEGPEFAASFIFSRRNSAPPPELAVQSAFLADLKSGEIYFEKSSEKRWPIASITKLMTAIVALKEMDQKQPITLMAEDFLVEDNAVAKNLKIGDTISANDLVRAMMTVSSNEAAQAIARIYGRDNFIVAMNNKSKEIGLDSTFFKEPTGLSSVNQSTANDLRKLALYINDNFPQIFEMSRQVKITITEFASKKSQRLTNINLFAGQYGFVGGKTGYTEDSNGNLLSVFSYGKRPVFVVVLGTDDRFGETEKLINWFRNSYELTKP